MAWLADLEPTAGAAIAGLIERARRDSA